MSVRDRDPHVRNECGSPLFGCSLISRHLFGTLCTCLVVPFLHYVLNISYWHSGLIIFCEFPFHILFSTWIQCCPPSTKGKPCMFGLDILFLVLGTVGTMLFATLPFWINLLGSVVKNNLVLLAALSYGIGKSSVSIQSKTLLSHPREDACTLSCVMLFGPLAGNGLGITLLWIIFKYSNILQHVWLIFALANGINVILTLSILMGLYCENHKAPPQRILTLKELEMKRLFDWSNFLKALQSGCKRKNWLHWIFMLTFSMSIYSFIYFVTDWQIQTTLNSIPGLPFDFNSSYDMKSEIETFSIFSAVGTFGFLLLIFFIMLVSWCCENACRQCFPKLFPNTSTSSEGEKLTGIEFIWLWDLLVVAICFASLVLITYLKYDLVHKIALVFLGFIYAVIPESELFFNKILHRTSPILGSENSHWDLEIMQFFHLAGAAIGILLFSLVLEETNSYTIPLKVSVGISAFSFLVFISIFITWLVCGSSSGSDVQPNKTQSSTPWDGATSWWRNTQGYPAGQVQAAPNFKFSRRPRLVTKIRLSKIAEHQV